MKDGNPAKQRSGTSSNSDSTSSSHLNTDDYKKTKQYRNHSRDRDRAENRNHSKNNNDNKIIGKEYTFGSSKDTDNNILSNEGNQSDRLHDEYKIDQKNIDENTTKGVNEG